MKMLEKDVWAFNYDESFDPDATEPQIVPGTGTGFMLIHRTVFEELAAKFPQWMYRPDGISGTPFDGSREIMKFFPNGNRSPIASRSDRGLLVLQSLSGDRHQDVVMSVVKLRHAGMYIVE
jgi:hypothetical protein